MIERHANLMGELTTIALATDGSSFSDGAIKEAIFFCRSCGARLVVLNIIAVDSGSESGVSAQATYSVQRREVIQFIENIKTQAAENGIPCEVAIEESYQPDKSIVELADKYQADLIIMGNHGENNLLKLNMIGGSLTSKVIGHRFPQVLVVPKECSINMEKILLATDGSWFGQMALKEALNLSSHESTLKDVFVLSVAKKELDLEKARELTETVCRKAMEKTDQVTFTPLALVGKPARVIVEKAKELDVGMIIIGGHGKGFSKLLMGHVTEQVIDKAHCAILVIEKEQ
ncbi:MAG: universal stress protein [Proteobacteria bacterium]|nr:universal stress protein [Pseudomonadota bacterium]MBU1057940.1 universal stress protein [Pseudomonadota bacterium]